MGRIATLARAEVRGVSSVAKGEKGNDEILRAFLFAFPFPRTESQSSGAIFFLQRSKVRESFPGKFLARGRQVALGYGFHKIMDG